VDAVAGTAAATAVGQNEAMLDDPLVFAVFYDEMLPLIVAGEDGVLLSYSTAATAQVGLAPNRATPGATVENATAVASHASPTPIP
jgi:hypothetical protein